MPEGFPKISVLLKGPGWAHLAASSESELDDYVLGLPVETVTVRIIRGQRCSSRERLFQEFAAALQFPHYFGENWDAFEDCLSDLTWLGDIPLLLVLANAEKILPGEEEGFTTFVSILNTIGTGEIAVLQSLLLHSDPAFRQATRERYVRAGLSLA